ncbi:MAG TPA: M23 family metallopeptidase [Chitinophagaceae bacterium]|nr:M23 family metallopeptidase [Chitinophagaceae bacterium]
MRKIILLFLMPASCFSQTNYSIKDLKAGKFIGDASYVYALPFEKNKKVFLIQAYDSKMSHKGEIALDFKVKQGTEIYAAREGVVTSLRKDSDKGGLKDENLSDGNFIIIQHSDGSSAMYWHLQKNGVFINIGDTVQKGQLIGLCGNTGYSAFPHLHFEVQGYDAIGNYKQIPTRFQTNKGIRYLRPGKFYRNS